jgi:small-conductance mechanosensitive channel
MKTNFLLPHKYKKFGWVLLVPGLLLGIISLIIPFESESLIMPMFAIADSGFMEESIYFGITSSNISDEVIGLLIIIGSILVALTKQKEEDEFISRIRLESLVWSTYVNYIILILTILFVFGGAFYWVLVFNMFTILLFFIVRFNWMLHRANKSIKHEE